MSLVLLLSTISINEDVVHAGDAVIINQAFQGLVNVGLERRRSVRQPKGYNQVFKLAISGPEGSLPTIGLLDTYLVVGVPQIQLGKELRTTQPIQDLGDQGEGVAVLNYHFIETPIVHTQAEAIAVLLRDEQY